jgi:anaerobic ribonucleoside-triphosphate reductase activating protein
MRYYKVVKNDIANGVGIRTSLFVQGCNFKCKGCFNSSTWDFNGGNEWNKETQNKFIQLGNRDYIKGYSILGGEPLAQDESILDLVKDIKSKTNKSIWMWTGFLYESLNDFQKEVISYVDVLIDGQFKEELKDLSLQFRGSSNQRIIDIKESIKQERVVLWQD